MVSIRRLTKKKQRQLFTNSLTKKTATAIYEQSSEKNSECYEQDPSKTLTEEGYVSSLDQVSPRKGGSIQVEGVKGRESEREEGREGGADIEN